MAEIVPYRDQITPELGPNTGTDALISSARRVGPLEREAGLAVSQGTASIASAAKEILAQREKVAAQQEIAGGVESHALLQGQHEADLNQLLSNPDNLKDINGTLAKFQHDTLDPETADWVSKFQTQAGQEWATIHGAQQGAELLKHGRSMSSLISADNAAVAVAKGADQYAANAIANPQSTEMQIKAALSGIDAMAKTIDDPVKRAEFMKLGPHVASQIAYAGAHAATNVNPALGTALGKQLAQYMNPEHQTSLENYVNSSERMNLQQAKYDRTLAIQEQKDAGDRWANNINVSMYDPATQQGKVPTDFMQNMQRAAADPNLRISPGTFNMIIDKAHALQAQAARGTPTVTDPATYNDFAQRQFLGPGDPKQLTNEDIGKARTADLISDHDEAMFRQNIAEAAKNPQLTVENAGLKQFLDSNKISETPTQANNQAVFAFEKDRTEKFWYQRRLGVSAEDLTNPKSPKFLGNMTPQEKSAAAVAPTQQLAPASIQQKQLSTAVDVATAVAGFVRDNDFASAKKELDRAGMSDLDPTKPWCAPLVNAALKAVGAPDSGSGLASSFKDWGNPINPADAKRGDVFYVPDASGNSTGHVGFLTGQTRVGSNGQPQVEVVSSHLQGASSNDGGVEWRNVSNMLIRRAKPPLADITPSTLSRIGNWFTGVNNSSVPR